MRRTTWLGLLLSLALVSGCSSTHTPGTPGSIVRSSPSASGGSTDSGSGSPAPSSPPATPALTEAIEPTASPSFPDPSTAAGQRAYLTAVFTDAQTMWSGLFADAGIAYQPARLVLFTSAVDTGCGSETAEVGPFYCPADHGVYLDVSFFDDMEHRYGVSGDFAQAFVVAHELGHHVQNLLGTSALVAHAQQSIPSQANALSIGQELQADCYAGVWAHATYTKGLLTEADLKSALAAAAAVGDDFLQHQATGHVQPEQWTHGSSSQRQQWLVTGVNEGKPTACATFNGQSQP